MTLCSIPKNYMLEGVDRLLQVVIWCLVVEHSHIQTQIIRTYIHTCSHAHSEIQVLEDIIHFELTFYVVRDRGKISSLCVYVHAYPYVQLSHHHLLKSFILMYMFLVSLRISCLMHGFIANSSSLFHLSVAFYYYHDVQVTRVTCPEVKVIPQICFFAPDCSDSLISFVLTYKYQNLIYLFL